MRIISAILVISVAGIIGWSTKNSIDSIFSGSSVQEVVAVDEAIPQQ